MMTGPSTLLRVLCASVCLAVGLTAPVFAQGGEDSRTQFPALLRNSFVTISLGTLSQPFVATDAAPDVNVSSVEVPPIAARLALVGHEVTDRLSVQLSYQRPVSYVRFVGLNGGGTDRHRVRVNFGSLTLKLRQPISERVSVFGETGLGLTSRTGFATDGEVVVTDAHYASAVVGAGLDYRVTPTWSLTAGVTYSPGKADIGQPRTLYTSGGFRYTMRALPPEKVDANRRGGYVFPRQIVQIEYSSGLGYGVNNFVSRRVPIFWGGHAHVDFGIAPHYERNVFHTRKRFALDVGASAGVYRTQRDRNHFVTVSLYPLFRFLFLRRKAADLYVAYSMAGPTYISRTRLDGLDTGRRFTFQDFIGIGMFAGTNRNVNVGVKINHYSNGNIFTQNAGVKIPLTFSIGYAF